MNLTLQRYLGLTSLQGLDTLSRHLTSIIRRARMLPACRTAGAEFAIPPFDLAPRDVTGFLDDLQEFQSLFHDCFPRSEPRAHFFDYMVGQLSPLERKSIEPMALRVPGGSVRGLQRSE